MNPIIKCVQRFAARFLGRKVPGESMILPDIYTPARYPKLPQTSTKKEIPS